MNTDCNHFEARNYDPVIGRWMSVDPKRVHPSPYVGMGNNPIIYGDPDGRDIVLLNSSAGARGYGHIAFLVGNNTDGWRYISKNGTEEHGAYGPSYKPDLGDVKYDAVKGTGNDFRGTGLTAEQVIYNINEQLGETHSALYDRYSVIESTQKQDAEAYKAGVKAAKSTYKLLGASCLDCVQGAVKSLNINSRYPMMFENPVPNDWFEEFSRWNTTTHGNWFKVGGSPKPSIEVGEVINGGRVD